MKTTKEGKKRAKLTNSTVISVMSETRCAIQKTFRSAYLAPASSLLVLQVHCLRTLLIIHVAMIWMRTRVQSVHLQRRRRKEREKRIAFHWERDLSKKISDATGSTRSTNEFRKIELAFVSRLFDRTTSECVSA